MRPEIFFLVMAFEAVPHHITLADIHSRQFIIGTAITHQDVHAGTGKLLTAFYRVPPFAGENHPYAGPVHAIYNSHAFGVTVRNKDADGELVDSFSAAQTEASAGKGE